MPRRFAMLARLHIWLGWLIAVPLLMWTISGLVMVSRPIDEVRGEDLRRELVSAPLPDNLVQPASAEPPVELRIVVQQGRAVSLATFADGSTGRFSATTGAPLPALTEAEARALVAQGIIGGERVEAVREFSAAKPPFDFRRPLATWQVTLDSGTRIYVGRETGQIEAVRTRFWRVFDTVWGLHIMDLEAREDTHHPILIVFAALSTVGVLIGTVLLFRRRRARRR